MIPTLALACLNTYNLKDSGLFRGSLGSSPGDTLSMDRALRNSDKVNLDLVLSAMERGLYRAENQSDQKVSTSDPYAAMQVAEKNLWEHRSGLEYLSVLLEMAKSEIASDGYMSEKIRQKILFAFCFSDYPFAVTCNSAGPPEAKVEDGSSEKGTDIETAKERADFVIACIDFQLKKISVFKEYALEHENLALDAEARSFNLPPADATDKLLRRVAHLDRNSIAPWTNWSVCNGSAEAKMCRRLSTLIWERKPRCETKPRSALISIAGSAEGAKTEPNWSQKLVRELLQQSRDAIKPDASRLNGPVLHGVCGSSSVLS